MGAGAKSQGLLLGVLLAVGVVDLAWLNLTLAPELARELALAEGAGAEAAAEGVEPVPDPAESAVEDRAAAKGTEGQVGTQPEGQQGESPAEGSPNEPAAEVAVAQREHAPSEPAPAEAAPSEPTPSELAEAASSELPPSEPVAEAAASGPPPELPSLRFGTAESTLSDQARRTLRRAAEALKARDNARIHLRGHADQRGSDEVNRSLGASRAARARRYLVRLGVDIQRITTESAGADRPVDSSDTPEAWAKNRRVELIWRY